VRVLPADTQDYAWLLNKIGYEPTFDFRAIKAVNRNDHIEGMVGFDNTAPNSMEIHFYTISVGAVRALLRPTFEWGFEQAGKNVLIGRLRESESKARRFVRHLGFREAYRVRDGWAKGEDLIIVEMPRAACRWIRKDSHGQERRAAS
jgi:hypothetical protein